MPALQALRQSVNALVGVTLTEAQLRDRVRGRYPDAEPLPGRPQLDRLLEAVGAPLAWSDAEQRYSRQQIDAGASAGTTTFLSRRATQLGRLPVRDGDAAPDAHLLDAQALERRLQQQLRQGGLLTLTVEPRLARHAEAELLRRFGAPAQVQASPPGRPKGTPPPRGADDAQRRPGGTSLQRLSVDALLLRELRAQAAALKVDWATVLRADATTPGTRDWTNLLRLVQRCMPTVRQALLTSPAPLLVVNAGLLARYGQMSLLIELEQTAGRPGQTPTAWLLLPGPKPGVAEIDGSAAPLVYANAVVAVGEAWIRNPHRGTPAPH
jgi:hypothetical protein